jgi:DMSO/TMAO reductase YedYZ molybdopterin-dependent catalytic subunit
VVRSERVASWGLALIPTGAGVGAQWLLHIAMPRAPFAPFSVGEWIIRHTPGGLATMVIDVLGRWALRILAAVMIAGALFAGLALRRLRPVLLGATALAASLGAAALDPGRPPIEHSIAAALVAAGAATLAAAAIASEPRGVASVDLGRRRLLAGLVGGVGMLALGGGALWRALRAAVPARIMAARPLAVHPDPAFDHIRGLSPLVTPREDHYVVDVDLVDPVVSASGWRLAVDGEIGRALALSLDDLLDMPTVERLVCMSCISNPVGGRLVSDSTWTGVLVRDVLAGAGLSGGATSLGARGADGYFETVPLDAATLQFALVAIAMDGALLPREHGYPARLLVPGRYGYKSVKWLRSLSVVPGTARGYWVQRGWDPDGVIRTASRFDVPSDHAQVPARFMAAGVAWAGDRGISRVEVSSDDRRTWTQAELEPPGDPLAWRRWRLRMTLQPGVHALTVRAIDGTGAVQSATYLPPHPSGASGYHRVVVSVLG